ncbi:MAG: hypothetical protein D3910_14160 [Candidatus Electrothrix sp. ATG2]|nr:hypothetical protein [Candidatus Electrothrix sp. ATG2]
MQNQSILTRRQFMVYTAASAAGVILPGHAESGMLSCIIYLTRLQPTRFITGLLYDFGKAVVVTMVSNHIAKQLSSHQYSPEDAKRLFGAGSRSSGLGSLVNEHHFQPPLYKASVITLGIGNYELHSKRKFKMKLTREAEKQRFRIVLQYLRDEKIKIKIAGMDYALPANKFDSLEPDDLLTLERWHLERHQEKHVLNLIAATEVSAFDELAI